ncbi:hypothetical protein RFI_04501 [Reticulomyxa filosa]|uniref:Uncharacterized protein n=1 Tax=Reticulomyxa filosa TaxID=46433 RepID=X6P3A7_RETFI|nr:hypothetical protein RFI_39464 [Reticulomyxa filosa]ETO32613.1 hypothetical protein RFI_04501 [Reticulomyxa filosa]|eukprot:ETN98059.1 hypothetical protein RFI_39464 [Reticulomyxa filosa]
MATDSNYPKSPTKGGGQSVASLELEIKNVDQFHLSLELKRDNQALQAELRKLKEAQNKKGKTLEQEKEMRLQANQDRYWLRQKLSRMQMAINARLKMLGIDFDNCDDLSSALDAAFSAIQKLSLEVSCLDYFFLCNLFYFIWKLE